MRIWLPDEQAYDATAPLPDEVEARLWDGSGRPPPDAAEVEMVVTPNGPAARTVAAAPLPRLRLLQTLTAGVDAVLDVAPAHAQVASARGAHDTSTAEWVLAATLAAQRELPAFERARQAHRWEHRDTRSLAGSRVLLVGAGSVSAAVAARLAGFEVDVVRVARRPRSGVHGVGELPTLLPDADVVVLVVPLTPDTRGLVDAAFLARLPDGALLVNAARGPVVDTEALLAELARGRLRAALDVTDPEPLWPDSPLWDAPGLLLTPHVAGSTERWRVPAYRLVRRQVRHLLAGEPPENVVSEGY